MSFHRTFLDIKAADETGVFLRLDPCLARGVRGASRSHDIQDGLCPPTVLMVGLGVYTPPCAGVFVEARK